MQVTVDADALAEWSANARRTATQLDTRLGALDDGLAPLVGRWDGAAADAFAARHRQWRRAADGLLDTLTALAELVDTAHDNYRSATAANARIWRTGGAPAVTTVQAAGRGSGRGTIRADLEAVRTAVTSLVAATVDLGEAWEALSRDLGGSAAMAGDDEAGAAFAADYDGMAAAAWQGWRSSALMLDGIAGGLAATGNNLAGAERDSTAGRPPSFPPIVAGPGPTPVPAAPPTASGGSAGDPRVPYWPTADPERLRTAAAVWRASADGVHGAVTRAFDAVDGLAATSPDVVLEEMRRFVRAVLSDDPTAGLTGVLRGTGGRIASACDGLADVTERTRSRVLATLAHYAGGDEWYHPVADVIDLFVRFRAAHAIAAAGDAYLLDLDLSTIRDEHVRAVDSVRGELHPAGADRLVRLATAMSPPVPVPADTCAVTAPAGRAGDPVPEAQRQALIAEVAAAGHKISPTDVVQIARAADGRIVWLERGNDAVGLSHILRAERIADFARRGIPLADIPGMAIRAVTTGTPVGRVGRDGTVYQVDVGGHRESVVVVVGSNGFIVSAYPPSSSTRIKPL